MTTKKNGLKLDWQETVVGREWLAEVQGPVFNVVLVATLAKGRLYAPEARGWTCNLMVRFRSGLEAYIAQLVATPQSTPLKVKTLAEKALAASAEAWRAALDVM